MIAPSPPPQPHRTPFGGDFRATNLDLALATVIAVGLPLAARWLFDATGGALASLALYYGLCCVLVVRWRKGTLDYRWPARWPWALFAISLLVPLANAATNWGHLPDAHASTAGFLVTLLVWAPLNAAMEQLAWLYVLDAWRNRWEAGPLRWVGLAVGDALLLALVGLIHVLFWIRFLPVGDSAAPLARLTVPINFLLTGAYVALYYRARSMWPVFVVHLCADAQLVLIAHYSIPTHLLLNYVSAIQPCSLGLFAVW